MNLKDPPGPAIVLTLLATVDVFSKNVKTGRMDDLSLGEAGIAMPIDARVVRAETL